MLREQSQNPNSVSCDLCIELLSVLKKKNQTPKTNNKQQIKPEPLKIHLKYLFFHNSMGSCKIISVLAVQDDQSLQLVL